MAGGERKLVALAVEDESDLAVVVRTGRVVGERKVVRRAVGGERLGAGRLVGVALEAPLAAGLEGAGAVFEEDPILGAVAVEADRQRVGRAPAARESSDDAGFLPRRVPDELRDRG